jgi:hypothetical protein
MEHENSTLRTEKRRIGDPPATPTSFYRQAIDFTARQKVPSVSKNRGKNNVQHFHASLSTIII